MVLFCRAPVVFAAADDLDDFSAQMEVQDLNRQVQELSANEKYADAFPIAEKALALARQKLKPDSLELAWSLSHLGNLYYNTEKYGEAEPLHRQALEIREKVLGANDPVVALTLTDLGDVYFYQRRYENAEAQYRRALSIREAAFGSEHRLTIRSLQDIGDTLVNSGRLVEAEAALRRALALREKAFGSENRMTAYSLGQLARCLESLGRYVEAEPLLARALAIREKALGVEHKLTAFSAQRLADNRLWLGRMADAGPLYERALAIREKSLGSTHPDTAESLRRLGGFSALQGKEAEAEMLQKKAISILETALGPDHVKVGEGLVDLAGTYQRRGELFIAEPLYKRALTIFESSDGADKTIVAYCLNGLGLVAYGQDRYAEAEAYYKRSLAILEANRDAKHPDIGYIFERLADVYYYWDGHQQEAETFYKRALATFETSLPSGHVYFASIYNNLAWIYRRDGRYGEAEKYFKLALKTNETALGADHYFVAQNLGSIGNLYMRQGLWAKAASFLQSSADHAVQRARLSKDPLGRAPSTKVKNEVEEAKDRFVNLIKVSHQLAAMDADGGKRHVGVTFRAAQRAQGSEAASSLAQMSARHSRGDEPLAVLVRERQDLVGSWQTKDRQLLAARSEPPKGGQPVSTILKGELTHIESRIGDINARLKAAFPDYAELAAPEPLEVADVQSYLYDGEALLLVLDTPKRQGVPEETFVWIIPKSGEPRWLRSDIGTSALTGRVAGLRCGLDASAWDGDGEARCQKLLSTSFTHADAEARKSLPFDAVKAHELYKALLGEAEDLLKSPDGSWKHLIVVPSGPLQVLPFQVLVTDPPRLGDSFADVSWLGQRQAITVLPAVSSLKALRARAGKSGASKPMIAFANPVLDGDANTVSADGQQLFALRREAAHYRQSCAIPKSNEEMKLELVDVIRSANLLGAGPAATIVRSLPPVPGTAKISCDIAESPGFEGSEVLLGRSATETRLKELNKDEKLKQYRIVQFATHGVTAGQVTGYGEPGLILTPPDGAADGDDDGYLSASEITELKLDADWVILTACNTAAGGGTGGEALSGLARAFFYAQARTPLVSHWSVNESAAVQLVTGIMRHLRTSAVGRSEALHRAISDVIRAGSESGKEQLAHPAFWAPFVVAGEGAAAR